MHVLTKIFIVLVSLLAVLLVPLVVVYAHNEDSYKARYEQATANAQSAQSALDSANRAHQVEQSRLQQEVATRDATITGLRAERDEYEAAAMEAQAALAAAESAQTDLAAKLATLATGVEAGNNVVQSLLADLRQTRESALQNERRLVEMEDQLRDVTSQLEVAVAARRAAQEELQRVREERTSMANELAGFYAQYPGARERIAAGSRGAVIPTQDIDATILNVSRNASETRAEINAGARDGVVEGMEFNISTQAGFMGKLRIIEVDINRAIGVVELEGASGLGNVAAGMRAWVTKGQP